MFDPDRALEIAKQFAFPRLSGSTGNSRAIKLILQTLQNSQIQTQSQFFHISHFPVRFLGGALALEVALLAGRLLYPNLDLSAILLLAFAAALFTSQAWINLGVSRNVWESSEMDCNVVTEVLGSGDREILFLAHHDSKSQGLPLVVRISAFCALIVGHFVALLPLFVTGNPTLTTVSTVAVWGALSLSLLLSVSLVIGNNSFGAMDNASGVGVVLALAEAIKQSPVQGLRIRFLFTGEEELGLQGAYHYCKMTDDVAETVINVDTVGAGNWLWIYGSRGRLQVELRSAAKQSGLSLVRLPMLFGMLADHLPFVRSEKDAVTTTLVSPALRFLHTAKDRSSILRLESFQTVSRMFEEWLHTTENHLGGSG